MDYKLIEKVTQFLMGKKTRDINFLSIPQDLQCYDVDEFNFDEEEGTILVLSPKWLVELKVEAENGTIVGLTEIFSRA